MYNRWWGMRGSGDVEMKGFLSGCWRDDSNGRFDLLGIQPGQLPQEILLLS